MIGRNFTHQTISDVIGFFDKDKFNFNPFIASGAIGMCIDEFNGDNFDHGPLGFVGGGYMGQVQTNGRPIETTHVPPGTPRWGAKWKSAVRDNYLSTVTPGHRRARQLLQLSRRLSRPRSDLQRSVRPSAGAHHASTSTTTRSSRTLSSPTSSPRSSRRWAPSEIVKQYRKAPYDITKYQTTHLCGGAIMGTDPKTSALNRYLQSWDVPNLFVMGASAFPQNAGYNPTGTLAALAFWAAEAIRDPISQEPGAARPCLGRRAPIAAPRSPR